MAVFSGNGSNTAPSFTFSSDTNTGIYRSDADTLGFTTGGTNWMTLDPSGFLGVGAAPQVTLTLRRAHSAATATGYTGALLIHDEQNSVAPHLGAGVSYSGGAQHSWIQSNNNPGGVYPLMLQPAGGTVAVGTITTSLAPLTVNGTVEYQGSLYRAVFGNGYVDGDVRLATGGNGAEVQIQTASSSRGAALSLGGPQGNNENLGVIAFFNSGNTDGKRLRAYIRAGQQGATANEQGGSLSFATAADAAGAPTVRMVIDSTGVTAFGSGVGNTGAIQSGAPACFWLSATSNTTNAPAEFYGNLTSTRHHVAFSNPNGVVGSISTNASATAYNTSSDYRLKENVTAVTDGITRLQQLKPSRFNFIAEPDTVVDGFIAHEVAAVVPEAVTGEKDAVDDDGKPAYQGIDQAKLVPLLTAALQEAVVKIESLEGRIAALGG